MKKSLFEYVTECNKKGIMPKGLTSPYERTEVMVCYNNLVNFGSATTLCENVKKFFEKFGYAVEWAKGSRGSFYSIKVMK